MNKSYFSGKPISFFSICVYFLFFSSLKAQTPVYTRFIAQPDSFKARFDCNYNCDTVYYGYNYGFILKKISPRGDTITLDTLKPTIATQRFKLLDTMSVGNKFFFEWYDDSNGYFNLVVIDSTGSITSLPSGYLGPFFKGAFLINGFYYYQWLSNPSFNGDPLELLTSEFDGTNWVGVTSLPGRTGIAANISAPVNYSKYTPLSFTVTAKNTGTTEAKNIKIQLSPVEYTSSGGNAVASIGAYQEFCPDNVKCRTWTIPALGVGQTATLTVPVFVLDPNGTNIIAKAYLLASNPQDANTSIYTAAVVITASGGNIGSDTKTDIAVTITAPTTYKKYTPSSFTIVAKNTGTIAVTNIKLQLSPVTNTVSGGTPTASAGDYKEFCPGNIQCRTWTIPNLNAGDSATLTVPVFVLDPNGANITAKVNLIASTPTDGNPANDTASVTLVSSEGTTTPPAAKPDIAVTVASSPATYKKYTFLNYTLTAKNVGSAEMRDIKIKFTQPNGTANPGDTKAGAGIYNDYCAGGVHCQTWSIPVLGINQSATLIIPVFVLDPGAPITATATLISSTPTDLNGTNDVGSVTTSQTALQNEGDVENFITTQNKAITISPNPASDAINIEMQSTTAQDVQFLFYNMQGSNIKSEQRQTEIGANRFSFDVSNLPSGLYYLQTAGEKMYLPTVKLVKN